MALTVELREEDSGEHAFRVAMWAHLLALEHGLDPSEAERNRTGSAAARHRQGGHPRFGDSQRTALSQGERQLIETHAAAARAS